MGQTPASLEAERKYTMKNKNKAAQALAKLKHKKNPMPREHYVHMSKLGVEARRKKREEEKARKDSQEENTA